MSDWLWRVLQAAIVIAVGWWFIYMDFQKNYGLVPVLLGVGAAWLLTVLPLKIWLWFLDRRNRGAIVSPGPHRTVRRDESAEHDLDLL